MRRVSAFALSFAACGLQAQSLAGGGNPLDQLPLPNIAPQTKPIPLRVDGEVPAGAAAGRLDQTLTPSRFDIEGVNAIDFAKVASLFAPMAKQSVTVRQLVAAAAQATAMYRAQGHPLSFVYVPAQSFDGNLVRVVAVEGFIASVRIEGDAGAADPKLRAIAQRVTSDRPLFLATFERVSQLLTRVPGITLTAEAALPSSTDGASVLVLKVKRQPYNLSLGLDLRQPSPRAVLTGVLNDVTVPGSQLSASVLLGNFHRENFYSLGYSQLVGSDGLVLKGSYSEYRGYPDAMLGFGDALAHRNLNQRSVLSASYPLLLNSRTSLTLDGGAYAVNNTDSYLLQANGTSLTDETRVRALYSQLAWTDNTASRARSASVLLAQGLKAAGASASQTSNTAGVARPNPAQLDFSRLTFDASQRDRFDSLWGTAVSFGAQFSPNTLATSERVSFGGSRFGRAYAPGDGSGDSGWGAGFELNRPFQIDGGAWLKQLEFYLLYEAARVKTKIGEPQLRRLASAAFGLRLSDRQHYHLDLALAQPIGDAAMSNPLRRPRLSISLNYQLGER